MRGAAVSRAIMGLVRRVFPRRRQRPEWFWSYVELLRPHPEGDPVGTDTKSIRHVPARRSRKKAKRFRRALQEVFGEFDRVSDRRAARRLLKMPPIDGTASPKFLGICEEGLGGLPRCPNDEFYDLTTSRVNVCLLGNVTPEGEDMDGDPLAVPGTVGWYVAHFQSASMRTLRGRALRQPSPRLSFRQKRRGYIPPARDPLYTSKVLVSEFVAKYRGNERASAFSTLVVSRNGRDWQMLTVDGYLVRDVDLERLANTMQSLEWGNRFYWSMVIKRPPSPGIQIFLTARNVLEFLWMRDVEIGKKRRRAMVHLVRPHERKLASGKTTTVRPHLRGSMVCDWKGLSCSITPSEHDIGVLRKRMLPGQDLLEFIEANCDRLGAP